MSSTEPRHPDDPASRTPGGAAFRGVLLIAVAVLLGFVLLQANDEPDPFTRASANGGNGQVEATTTTEPTDAEPGEVRPPGEVKALVANGSSVQGAGSAASNVLVGAGYNVLSAVNAKAPVTQPAVYYTEGFVAEARLVAAALGIDPALVAAVPSPAPVDDDRGYQVLVVLDEDAATRLKAEASAETPPADGAGG